MQDEAGKPAKIDDKLPLGAGGPLLNINAMLPGIKQ